MVGPAAVVAFTHFRVDRGSERRHPGRDTRSRPPSSRIRPPPPPPRQRSRSAPARFIPSPPPRSRQRSRSAPARVYTSPPPRPRRGPDRHQHVFIERRAGARQEVPARAEALAHRRRPGRDSGPDRHQHVFAVAVQARARRSQHAPRHLPIAAAPTATAVPIGTSTCL